MYVSVSKNCVNSIIRSCELYYFIVCGSYIQSIFDVLRELVRQEISSTLESRLHIDFHELLIALILARDLSGHA